MSRSFSLEQLSEGIKQRHLGTVNKRLVEKWNRTGLLRGLEGQRRENMASLLENQAAQLLREVNSIGAGGGSTSDSGDLRGFTNIAFPIVRRVFGGLVANELVSIQPMSLPSGLLFYLDYTYGNNVGGDGGTNAATYAAGQSIYNSPTGKGVQSGSLATGGQYDLVGTAFSKVHTTSNGSGLTVLFRGAFGANSSLTNGLLAHATGSDGKFLQFDPQVGSLIEEDALANGALDGTGRFQFLVLDAGSGKLTGLDTTNVKSLALFSNSAASLTGLGVIPQTIQGGSNILNVRRLTQLGTFAGGVFTPDPLVTLGTTNAAILTVVSGAYTPAAGAGDTATLLTASFAKADTFSANSTDGSAITVPVFESDFSTSNPSPAIPEIDIKIESIAVTATTRKLRARWSPELAQDLNAYHSLDAEVELTQILSEQIALEIDREILNDLLTQAKGANFFWSRAPGKFVNKTTGTEVTRNTSLTPGPAFTGTVREWYETLIETIIDVGNEIHRKTLRGSANFIVVGPDVATVLEASVYYKPAYSIDGSGQVGASMSIGAEKIGTLSNRFTVYKDPYFPRNKILVGFKGGSYLETGYVYAPYVPLIVTPTIFAPEDFTPRKGVMTRYGKKMVRADFYGTVTCLDMNII
jgi:hypothetical protein